MSKAYEPLHLKYRPQRFDDLIGQESIAITLKQAITTNKIAPAYLFSGPRGTGKTSSARIFAKSLNCLQNDSSTLNPCGQCDLCKSIALGTALDVIEIDAASNTGVDNIRDLIEKSQFAPVQARWKVYVIDECHMLSTAAFNALLKTLEEPPKKVVFILATTDPQRVLATILSRCQRFDFRRIPLKSLIEHLGIIASQEGIEIETDAIEIIAKHAQGGLRDAESMLDQLSLLPAPIESQKVWDLLGVIPENELLDIASALIKKEPISVLNLSKNLLERGREPISILQGFASIIRDLIIKNAAPENLELCSISIESQKKLEAIANKIKLEDLLRWQSELKGTEYQLRQSLQPKLWLEVLLLGLLSSPDNTKSQKTNINNENKKIKQSLEVVSVENNTQSDKKDLKVSNINKDEKSNNENANNNELNNLSDLWNQILGSLELPSTRMLLSQQAELIKLTKNHAEIKVSANWISMIQSRKMLIEEAIRKTLGSHKDLIIKGEDKTGTNSIVDENTKESSEIKLNPIQKLTTINLKAERIGDNQKKIEGVKTEHEDDTNKKAIKFVPSEDSIDKNTKKLADFFNGEIVELD